MPVILFGQYYTVFCPPYASNIGEPILIPWTVLPDATRFVQRCCHVSLFSPAYSGCRVGNRRHRGPTVEDESPYLQCVSAYALVHCLKRPISPSTRNPQHTKSASHKVGNKVPNWNNHQATYTHSPAGPIVIHVPHSLSYVIQI